VRFRPDAANWQWQIEVIDDPKTINAFCMAGGKMGIYTGFWTKLHATDDELAQVMGHEIGHALASHPREGISTAIGVAAGSVISQYVSEKALQYAAGTGFIAIGIWTLVKA